MESVRQNHIVDEIKPPITQVGIVGWIRTNLFKGWLNSILTLITIYILWKIVSAEAIRMDYREKRFSSGLGQRMRAMPCFFIL